jgi:hypothetical protein
MSPLSDPTQVSGPLFLGGTGMLVLLTAALSACTPPVPRYTTKPDHTLSFNAGAILHIGRSGTFTDARTGEEFFYFGTTLTHERVRVMRRNGDRVLDIPLGPAIERAGPDGVLTMVSWDSILWIGIHQDNLMLIDSVGMIKAFWDLDTLVANDRGDIFDLLPPFGTQELDRSCLYFGLDWRADRNTTGVPSDKTYELPSMDEWYREKNTAHELARVCLDLIGPPTVELALDSLCFHRSGAEAYTSEVSKHWYLDDRVFMASEFSSDILVLSTRTLAIEDTLHIELEDGEVGLEVLTATEQEARPQEEILSEAETRAQVRAVKFDRTTGHILVFVQHNVPLDAPAEKRGMYRPFSVLVYDRGLNGPLAEHVLEGTEHSVMNIFSTASGIYLARQQDREAQAKGVHILDHFVFHAP